MSMATTGSCYWERRWPERPDPQREIWVYDVALSLPLAQVIRSVESLPPDSRPTWWAPSVEELRVVATISAGSGVWRPSLFDRGKTAS